MSGESSRNAPMLGPRGQARRRALLDAAAKLFVEKGFEKTTLSDIVHLAGGSRATLYEQFGDKEGLFRAVMEENNRRISEQMAAAHANSWRGPEAALTSFGLRFVWALMDEQIFAVLRILITEAERLPGVAEAFWEIGPDTGVQRVADYLRHATASGQLRVEDPLMAAHSFIAMITTNMIMRRLMLPQAPVDMAAVETMVRASVRLFLDGVRMPSCPQEATP